ncbi:biotin--[acetyl-CoA-carboxylase] ligase [Inconstantimicrobium mannanitabidum]|uniref:biotin--[acetyl-CoA-carboxylase] ligase n=1 Tax=Inconstantimicrobium mannanitabidum TaxID=1604901 RepID=UPI002852972A|nr:biotin--[acetyl-CoA-carboxylase] ligase [Clostridium sp. TW13]
MIITSISNYYENLDLNLLSASLKTKYLGRISLYFKTIDSTNSRAKNIIKSKLTPLKSGTILIAEEQSAGRGRLERKWQSPASSGLLFTIVINTNLDIIQLPKTTLIVAAAICTSLKNLNVDAKIKWPNDIFINNRKIGGILTELINNEDKTYSLIIGIGLNINTREEDFSQEINNIATSLAIEYRCYFSRELILAEILNNFEKLWGDFSQNLSLENIIKICKDNSAILNKQIFLIKNGNYEEVLAKDLTSNGELVIEMNNGSDAIISSGEISIKLK